LNKIAPYFAPRGNYYTINVLKNNLLNMMERRERDSNTVLGSVCIKLSIGRKRKQLIKFAPYFAPRGSYYTLIVAEKAILLNMLGAEREDFEPPDLLANVFRARRIRPRLPSRPAPK
jgi:hypothetical protein